MTSRSRPTSAPPTRRRRRPSTRRRPARCAPSSPASMRCRATTRPDRVPPSRRGPSTPSARLPPARGERPEDDADQPGDDAEHHGAQHAPPEVADDDEAEAEKPADPRDEPEQQTVDDRRTQHASKREQSEG